jgi:MerR family transcriptional regulator/heat shock protein HspR
MLNPSGHGLSRHRSAQEVGMAPHADPARGVYAISIAADIVGTNIQNLRVYERRGLVEPSRTEGGTRLYSEADLHRLGRILELLEEGLNLAGIAKVLALEAEVDRLRGA